MNQYKKAQTEILGVVVIVIILLVAGIFMLSMSLREKDSVSDSFIDPELAQSFLNALMDTKTKKTLTVDKIIQYCYEDADHYCGQTSSSDCCDYAERVITNALDATLGEWGKKYRLSISRGSDATRIPVNGPDAISNGCNEFMEQEQPGRRTFSHQPYGIIEVELMICK